MRTLLSLLLSLFLHAALAGIGFPKDYPVGDLHLICIGIDDYQFTQFKYEMQFCESDAYRISEKISTDFYVSSLETGSVKSYLLTNEQASFERIKAAFKQVALTAKEHDYFIFYFAGMSAEMDGQSQLFTYHDNRNIHDSSAHTIGMAQLAEWMENIAANNQLVISEAGPGSEFAMSLISNLFESNPLIAEQNTRNRLILTTREHGLEGPDCSDENGGYLVKFMDNGLNLFSIFRNKDAFEYALIKKEMDCGVTGGRHLYTALFDEQTYRLLLMRQQLRHAFRSVVAEELLTDSLEADTQIIGRNIALIISTSKYEAGRPSWQDLENPKRDADAVSQILQEKYSYEIVRIHDKSKNEVLHSIKDFKQQLQEQDKVVVFIAGHGYYDDAFNSSYLIFTDGPSVQYSEAEAYQSYLNMSTLYNLLTKSASKQLFLILDVCFGAHFDLMAPDIQLSEYNNLELDMSLEEWIYRNDTAHRSRIFLASGKAEVPDYWSNSLDHSPFAAKLIKAMKEETQFLSPGKIYKYLYGNITEPVLKDFSNRQHDPRADFLMPVKQAE